MGMETLGQIESSHTTESMWSSLFSAKSEWHGRPQCAQPDAVWRSTNESPRPLRRRPGDSAGRCQARSSPRLSSDDGSWLDVRGQIIYNKMFGRSLIHSTATGTPHFNAGCVRHCLSKCRLEPCCFGAVLPLGRYT